MEDKIIHNILLKKAKEASYKTFEIEQINYQYEAFLIDYYLRRETIQILNNLEIKEEELKKFFEDTKERYIIDTKVKLDTIFVKTKEIAEKILEEINTKNFKEFKKKYDEKVGVENLNDKIPLSAIHPQIANVISKNEEKGILNEVVETNEGFHIVYLKEKEKGRLATYDEAKNIALEELRKIAFSQIYNDLIRNTVNEVKKLEENTGLNEQKEEK